MAESSGLAVDKMESNTKSIMATNTYSLRSQVTGKDDDGVYNKKEGEQCAKKYTLNVSKAMQKKAEQTKLGPLQVSYKSNNLVMEMSTAAYELVKKNIKIMLEEGLNQVVDVSSININNDDRTEQQGLNTDSLISIDIPDQQKFIVLSLYHTKSKIMVNGKGVQIFSDKVLPLIRDNINQNEVEIKEINNGIYKGLNNCNSKINLNETVSKNDESIVPKNETVITSITVTEEQVVEETAISSSETINEQTDDLVDFVTNNNQELISIIGEDDGKRKGNKRLRGDSQEEEEDQGTTTSAVRVERKERKVAEVEDQHNEKKKERPMSLEHNYAFQQNGEENELMAIDVISENEGNNGGVNTADSKVNSHPCQICSRNVASNAVQCDKCEVWIHYYCLRTTKKKLHDKYPNEYICPQCIANGHTDIEVNSSETLEEKPKDNKQREAKKKAEIKNNQKVEKIDDAGLNSTEPSEEKPKDNKQSEAKKKAEIKITQKERKIDNEDSIEMEKENKRLKAELKSERTKIEELKNEIKHKDKQLTDRKKESANLNKSLESNKMQLKTLNDKYDILKHQNDLLNEKITVDKSQWNDKLEIELQQQYVKYKSLESETAIVREKMQAQYTEMIGEKEEIISKKDLEIKEAYIEVQQLKKWLEQSEKSQKSIKEKEEQISNLEQACKVLTNDRDQTHLVNKGLEEKIHELMKQTSINIETTEASTVYQTSTSSTEVNSNECSQVISEKRKECPLSNDSNTNVKRNRTDSSLDSDMRTGSEKRNNSTTNEDSSLRIKRNRTDSNALAAEIPLSNKTGDEQSRDTGRNLNLGRSNVTNVNDNNSIPSSHRVNDSEDRSRTDITSDLQTEYNDVKQCYACGSTSHEIKDCDKRRNIYVRYNGDGWINRQGVRWAFQKYGPIKMIRIQKDRFGEETKSAMVCFERDEDAAEAIERMHGRNDWEVSWYKPKGRVNHSSGQSRQYNDRRLEHTQTRDRRQTIRTDRRVDNDLGKYKRQSIHWSVNKPNFFNERTYDDHFPEINRQNERGDNDNDIRKEVFSLKKQMSDMVKSINEMMTLIRYSA